VRAHVVAGAGRVGGARARGAGVDGGPRRRWGGPEGDFDDVRKHSDEKPVPGVAALHVESRLFFANADTIRKDVLAPAGEGTKAIVLDGQMVPLIGVTAAQMLESVAEDLQRDGIRFFLACDIEQVRNGVNREDRVERMAIGAYPTAQVAITRRTQTVDDRAAELIADSAVYGDDRRLHVDVKPDVLEGIRNAVQSVERSEFVSVGLHDRRGRDGPGG
jgi:MFS superfamily sulfate permease-like transporter